MHRRVVLLRLSVSFTQEAAGVLVETADEVGVTRTALVRQIVEQWLRDQRRLSTKPIPPQKRP